MLAMQYMIGMGRNNFSDEQAERIRLAWNGTFMMDDSGRSTGKSHNLLAVGVAKLPLIPDRAGILLGMDKEIGSELFNEHIGQWLQGDGHLSDFVAVRRSDMEGRISQKTYGRLVEFDSPANIRGLSRRGSRFMTMTPDLNKDAQKIQSWRFNLLHFNEWTSWPKPDVMAETIEPIATRTNTWHKRTVMFRESMEKHMQIQLGRLSNVEMKECFGLVDTYVPRKHLDGSEPKPLQECITIFMHNFRNVYGFDYNAGVQNSELALPGIKTASDIVAFFSEFLDGDPVLQNQIVYDGSAKRPSDPCYVFKQFFTEKVTEEKNKLYNEYNMSIEDLDQKWDGIIFSTPVIKKYKDGHLEEDYDRVYGGRWVEGYSNKPYDPTEIMACMGTDLRPAWDRVDGRYIITVDSAKGTERMRSEGGKRTDGLGQGDDAGAAVIRLGDGTPEDPDVIQLVYIADDVRKDPMANDIHGLVDNFRPEMLALDPGGGGGDLADSLAKRRLVLSDNSITEQIPIVPFDYMGDISNESAILHFISRGNKLIRAVHIQSDSQKDTWRTDDFLLNKIHETARMAFSKQTVALPRLYPKVELNQLYNTGKITLREMEDILIMNRAVKQIYAINYKMDTLTGLRVKTKAGLDMFVSPKRKDLAYCIIYAIFMANTFRNFLKQTTINRTVPISIG